MLSEQPLRHMVRHQAVGLGLTTTSRGDARADPIGLAVDRGDTMGEGGEIGDGGALDAEEMQTGLPWQHLVETINDGDQSIRAMDRAPAHAADTDKPGALDHMRERHRSEEHTSELQSLMRISYAVFCLKKKK